jgi:hypothetical protein
MTPFTCTLKGGSPYSEAGNSELWIRHHGSDKIEPVEIKRADETGYAGHGGGDYALVAALYDLFCGESRLEPGLDGLAGHRLAFLAEKSRIEANGSS